MVLSQSGLKETVYNDFYIGEDCDVIIVAGCGIDNCGQQDSQHTDRRHRDDEEHADVEVHHLHSLAPWQACKGHHRCYHHQEGGQEEQELVGVPQGDDFLGQNLEHVGKNLQRAPWTHADGAAAALNPAAHPALVHDVEHGQQRVGQQQCHSHDDTLERGGQPGRHGTVERVVEPVGDYTKVEHNLLLFVVFNCKYSVLTCRHRVSGRCRG